MLFRLIAVAAVLLAPVAVSAQSWPTQPMRWIVPYPAGGGTDFIARALGVQLENLSASRLWLRTSREHRR